MRWFRIRQRVVAACAIAILLGVGYYLVSLFQVWSTGRAADDGPVDAIVVMGAAQYDGRPSPQLAARLDHVVELWPEGLAPLVVVTGGNIPGDRFTEAEASATYLAERGVPMDALLLENDGSNSYESLEGVAALLDERGLDEVLIVTDPYHALRSRLIAEEVGLDCLGVVDGHVGRHRWRIAAPPPPGGRGSGRRTDHRIRSAHRARRLISDREIDGFGRRENDGGRPRGAGRDVAGVKGIEPLITEPETVVLPITPHPRVR